jgi:cation:H+ antiporter
LILFLIGNRLGRIDGIILLILFGFYSYYLVYRKERYRGNLKGSRSIKQTFFATLLFAGSLLVLFYSSKYVVNYASLIAVDLSIPQIIVGLFLVSFGTTLPELVFGIRAAQLGHGNMALGDQMGTVIANSTFILGIVALISPIEVVFVPFLVSALFLFLSAIIFASFFISEKRFTKLEGIVLILIYVVFMILEFFLKG